MEATNQKIIAGQVRANCTCCEERKLLVNHVQLGPSRMLCPTSRQTYLDRGDGIFEADGEVVENLAAPQTTTTTAQDLLSDRPTRTNDKTRITLERATFA